MKEIAQLLVALLLVATVTACSGTKAQTPTKTVTQYYAALQSGDYEGVAKITTKKGLKKALGSLMIGLAMIDMEYAALLNKAQEAKADQVAIKERMVQIMSQAMKKEFGYKKVEILKEKMIGDAHAVVTVKIDGEERSIDVIKEGDVWKVA